MATWNIGPFDNDDAVEWCARLEATAHDERVRFLRDTLERYLGLADPGVSDAAQALAAAATIHQAHFHAQVSDSPYAPRFLLGLGDLDIDRGLMKLGVRAFASLAAEGSVWRSHWAGDVESEEAFEMIKKLRSALAKAVSGASR